MDQGLSIVDQNKVPEFDYLNQCHNCLRKAGKYMTGNGATFGLYLIQDKRGYKMCNYCDSQGLCMRTTKLNKLAKKKLKKMKNQMVNMAHLPHITLDAEGNQV